MRYLIVVEGGDDSDGLHGYSAYSPDVLGCVAVGDTVEECKVSMQEALQAHIDWMLEDGDPLPIPHTLPDDPEIVNDPTLTPFYVDILVTQQTANIR